MEIKLSLERTFAGKQYENIKPRIEVTAGDNVAGDAKAIERNFEEMKGVLEKFGAEWKEEQLGKQ